MKGRLGFLGVCAALAVFSLVAAQPAAADDGASARGLPPVVDVELVLAVDVSWSMDYDEQMLQREGYASALEDPELISAIAKGDWGRIAVTYVEWAGAGLERIVVPWSIVANEADAARFAEALRAAPIGRRRRTSISSAILYAASLFDNGIDGFRKVIDVSGDGPNNMGVRVTDARDEALAEGITINGLPIMIKRANPGGYFHLERLDDYYRECVIGGFGAFMITVNEAERLQEAIRRKLILEIAGLQPTVIPARNKANTAGTIDCMIGEKQWQRWRSMDRW